MLIVPAPGEEVDPPVTLPEFRAHLALDSNDTSQDDQLRHLLAAAVDAVEERVGPIATTTRTDRVTRGPRRLGLLNAAPVLSVNKVTVDGATVDATGMDVDQVTGELWGVPHGVVRVTYTVGRVPVPPALKEAILVVAEHLYDTQRQPRNRGLRDSDSAATSGRGYGIPNRATDLMRPYRRARVL